MVRVRVTDGVLSGSCGVCEGIVQADRRSLLVFLLLGLQTAWVCTEV